jgi:hypothetical protein
MLSCFQRTNMGYGLNVHCNPDCEPHTPLLRLAAQVSVQSTCIMAELERLIPRMVIGSWSASRQQLAVSSAALCAAGAAAEGCRENAECFGRCSNFRPLVRALGLPPNEAACLAAIRCVRHMARASADARAALQQHGAVAELAQHVRGVCGALVTDQDREVCTEAVRALEAVVSGAPRAQVSTASGAPRCHGQLTPHVQSCGVHSSAQSCSIQSRTNCAMC